MRMLAVEDKSLIITRFDGRPAPDIGQGAEPQRTLAVSAVTRTRYRWTFAIAGKHFVGGMNTLAADGETFTEVSWRVDTPDNKITLIYERR